MINLETGKTVIELTEFEIDDVLFTIDARIEALKHNSMINSSHPVMSRYRALYDTIKKQREESK